MIANVRRLFISSFNEAKKFSSKSILCFVYQYFPADSTKEPRSFIDCRFFLPLLFQLIFTSI